MKHAVDAGHRSRSERAVFSATGPQEVRVEVVDVRCGELGQVEVTEVWPEVALDDGARMAHRGGRPAGRGGFEPPVEQVAEGAGPDLGPTGLDH